MPELRIGTSGFSYPHWREVLYEGVPQRRWLEHFATVFNTVELNVTFYRLPTEEMFDSWNERTPVGFLFALKGSRRITHEKRLADCEEEVRAFRQRVERLGEKLGPILWQLPPSERQNVAKLETFLQLLRRLFPARHAFEFRNSSWFEKPVFELLRASGAAVCLSDMPRAALSEVATADFVYVRRHGPGGRYRGCYSEEMLQGDATRVRQWLCEGRDVFVYFNNDIGGHAVRNADRLKELCK